MERNGMKNLLEETIEVLSKHGLTSADVQWIGTSNGCQLIRWETFAVLANREYYTSFGTQEVRGDLIIVGNTWWLEREEYEGAECWLFKRHPSLSLSEYLEAERQSLVIFNDEKESEQD